LLAWPDLDGDCQQQTRARIVPLMACLGVFFCFCFFFVVVVVVVMVMVVDTSTFGVDCLSAYTGPVVVHVGELLGQTFGASMWGQVRGMSFIFFGH
jgi:hypothetical protein